MALKLMRGLDPWNSNEATEAWTGGAGQQIPDGRYIAEVFGVGVQDKIKNNHRMVCLRIVEALEEENKRAVGLEINDLFSLEGEKRPQNFYKGIYEVCAPWALASQFMIINPQTQAAQLPIDWLVGDVGQPGTKVEIVIFKEERTYEKDDGTIDTRTFPKVQRGWKLVDYSSFAKRVVAAAGLNINNPEVPANHPPQQHLMPQQLVDEGAAVPQTPTGNGVGASATPMAPQQ